jgi:cytochrome oxidase assembly protein ShyY1
LIETRDWAQKTTGERINFVFTWFVLAFSLLLIVWISCITKKKLGELKRKDELEKKAEI